MVEMAVWFALEDYEYGLVSVVNRNLYCMLCRRACKHILLVEQLIESERCPESIETLSVLLKSSQTKPYKSTSPMGISSKTTPFSLLPSQQCILRKGAFLRKGALSFPTGESEDVLIQFILPSSTEPQQCPTCRSELLKCQVSLPFIFERSVHTGLGKI